MKNRYGILGLLAVLALVLYFMFRKNDAQGSKPLISPAVSGLSRDAIRFKWAKLEGVDSVAVQWKKTGGRPLGRLVTTGDQLIIRPGLAGEMLEFAFSQFSGGKESESAVYPMMLSSETSETRAIRYDSVGTVDIIIRAVPLDPGASIPAGICNLCPVIITTTELCDGTWFETGTPASDAYYKVEAEGLDAAGNPLTISFLLKITPAGDLFYFPAGTAVPCVNMVSTRVSQCARFTLYDDGVLAFEMHSTERAATATTPVIKGVLLRNLKNVERFVVRKISPCPEPR